MLVAVVVVVAVVVGVAACAAPHQVKLCAATGSLLFRRIACFGSSTATPSTTLSLSVLEHFLA